MPKIDHHITLPDGRRLSFAEFGDPDGIPVLYFHGCPSSRLEPMLIGDSVLASANLRVVALDRPGMGLSSFQAKRGFSAWPGDVSALADALGLVRFAVWGFSGGGPYAAVCAAKIPERLTNVVIVSGAWRMDEPDVLRGMPLPNRIMLLCARRIPSLLGLLFRAMAGMGQGEPTKELAKMKTYTTAPDYAWFEKEPRRFSLLGEIAREGVRTGTRGAVWDMRLYSKAFDFQLSDIRHPLTWFHGEDDVNYPIGAARRVCRGIPQVRLVACAHEAHLSLSSNRLLEVAEALR